MPTRRRANARAGRPCFARPPALAPRLLPVLVLLPILAFAACDDREPVRATLSVTGTLADADTAGFPRAIHPRPFTFPADHGPHPEYRHEWWYFTGNVGTAGGDADGFGFQLTFFRSALRPDSSALASPWATSQAFMAHFAMTSFRESAFQAYERFDRGALGLAGARREEADGGGDGERGRGDGRGVGARVWLGDWSAELVPAESGARPIWRVRASEGAASLDLVLTALKPVVLQGEAGLSRKGPEPGNASYYYSLTRMEARGAITWDGREHAVRGSAWLDREWGTSALGPDLAGWDWFSLQLDDGSELMVYRLRRRDGGTDPFSAGTYVPPEGDPISLGAADFGLEATGEWTGPAGTRYPSGWRIRVPRLGLDLQVDPRVRAQELDLAFRYWEGAVAVTGRRGDAPVAGVGYVELTGYEAAR